MRSDGQTYWHSLVLRTGSAGSFVSGSEGRFRERRDQPRGPQEQGSRSPAAVAVLFLSSCIHRTETESAFAGFSTMEALRAGPVTEWIFEDA